MINVVTDNSEKTFVLCYCLQRYRDWQTVPVPTNDDEDVPKNERSESGFDSITDGIFNSNHHDIVHIPLNIPLPPARKPPEVPIAISDFTPQPSPMPSRKFHKQPIPDINFIESTPSPVLKGNHDENQHLIEYVKSDESSRESEIKIDELNVEPSDLNVRKEGIIADKIRQEEMEDWKIKVYAKDRA